MAQNMFGQHLPAALILEKKRLDKNTIYTSKTTIGEANNSKESIRQYMRQLESSLAVTVYDVII